VHGGTEKTLEAWGITSKARVVFKSSETDEFSFDVRPADILAEPPFAIDDAIVLKKDGATWFTGFVREVPAAGSAKRELQSYVVKNLWDRLERLVFQQVRPITASDFATITNYATSDVILCQDADVSSGIYTKVDAGVMIDVILAFAAAHGVSFTKVRSFNGALPLSETARDLSCAAAVRRMLSWHPDVVTWVDYSTTPPTLHMNNRTALTVATINLSSANPEEFSLSRRDDLVPTGVVFNLLWREVNPVDNMPYARLTQQIAGASSGVGVIVCTVDMPYNQDGSVESPPLGPIAGGLDFAHYLYAMLSVVFFDGHITFKAADVPGTVRPGQTINFTGTTRTGWSTALALVQEVTEDIFSGRTEIRIGPTNRLSGSDLVALASQRAKLLKKDNPNPPIPPPSNGQSGQGGAANSVSLDLCDGTTVRVATAIAR
jgi:hypothetical protein